MIERTQHPRAHPPSTSPACCYHPQVGRVISTILSALFTGVVIVFGNDTSTSVLGMETVCSASTQPCWLVVGTGQGVLVIGAAGVGLVALTLYGAGLFFATGQLAAGLLAIGQLGFGVLGWIGQVGVGLTGRGQLIGGLLVDGQAALGSTDSGFGGRLSRDVKAVLAAPGAPYEFE